ncbi:Hypothetical protein HDN1F_33920 [gamma proteobacterium HdN1]|nr:Hypothetical protein HDN1F_33920 [gamma proteobacterium HdN1]
MNSKIMALGVALVLTISAATTLAHKHEDRRRHEGSSVRQLVKEGKILPLETLLSKHRDRLQGHILDLELERKRGQIFYEIEYIGHDGVVREAWIDAQTGEWVRERVDN